MKLDVHPSNDRLEEKGSSPFAKRSPWCCGKSMVHLQRGAQCSTVVAILEHAPASQPLAIEGSRDPDRQALDAACEGGFAVRFSDRMQVVRLGRVVDDAQPESIRACDQCIEERRMRRPFTKGGQVPGEPHRDVHGVAILQAGSRAMCDTNAFCYALAARTGPDATALERELELALHVLAHPASTTRSKDGGCGETSSSFRTLTIEAC